LSCGNKISLRHATLADLLLIPGVGDKTAQTLIKERAQILATANADGEAAGLESAKGIGPETAKKLMKYLGLK
jgi:DNA uptake protein ComE-like DNA-binding protein